MKKYNYSKLLGRMREKGFTQEDVAKFCNRSISTINNRLNGNSFFSQNDIKAIAEFLEIKSEDIGMYFFCKES